MGLNYFYFTLASHSALQSKEAKKENDIEAFKTKIFIDEYTYSPFKALLENKTYVHTQTLIEKPAWKINKLLYFENLKKKND